jgi:hypothetical protein
MAHGELRDQIITTAFRLIEQSEHGQVDGEDVVRELGLDVKAGEAGYGSLYSAFRSACDEGYLRCEFPGDMELPVMIRRP